MAGEVENIIDEIAGPEDTEADIEAAEKALESEAADADATGASDADAAEAAGADQADDAEASGAADGGEGGAPDKADPTKTVPLSALHESRDQTKALRGELSDTRDKIVRMETLWEQLQKRMAAPVDGEAAADIPDYDEDPEGYFRGTIAGLQTQVEALTKDNGERKEQDASTANEHQLLEHYAGSVRAFTKVTPDFQDAYSFLADVIDKDLCGHRPLENQVSSTSGSCTNP